MTRAALVVATLLLGTLLAGCASGGGEPAGGPGGMVVSIPRLGVSSDLVPLGLNPDRTMQVPPADQAQRAGWYDQGPLPGDDGPAVLVGQCNSAGRDGVFGTIAELREGDKITIRRGGRDLSFTVNRQRSASKDRFPTAEVYSDTAYPELRLITCGGELDRAARTYESNVIVFATLDV